MARDATADMGAIEAEAKVIVTSHYDGVEYFVDGDEQWYGVDGVTRLLGITRSKAKGLSGEWRESVRNGRTREFMSSSDLANVVNSASDLDNGTMRDLWVSAWYEDLTSHAEGGEGSPDMFHGVLGDFLIGLIEKNAKAEPTAEELDVRPASRRLEDMRLAVRGVLHGLGRAMGTLEDCVTYLDGFRSGCLVASGDVPGMGGIQNLFVDLRGVEDSVQRIHSELEDIVTGGDHE